MEVDQRGASAVPASSPVTSPSSSGSHPSTASSEIDFVFSPGGLFPAPLKYILILYFPKTNY